MSIKPKRVLACEPIEITEMKVDDHLETKLFEPETIDASNSEFVYNRHEIGKKANRLKLYRLKKVFTIYEKALHESLAVITPLGVIIFQQ